MSWEVIASVVVGSVAVVVLRPWRFCWARRRCPQCRDLLPRWDVWGWKEDWTCKRCGCRIEH
jgi:hypothetical protein